MAMAADVDQDATQRLANEPQRLIQALTGHVAAVSVTRAVVDAHLGKIERRKIRANTSRVKGLLENSPRIVLAP